MDFLVLTSYASQTSQGELSGELSPWPRESKRACRGWGRCWGGHSRALAERSRGKAAVARLPVLPGCSGRQRRHSALRHSAPTGKEHLL